MTSRLIVLDASVGVKWFALEAGRDEALSLLHQAAAGDVTLVVPDLFVYEVVRTVKRKARDVSARRAADLLTSAGLVTVPPVAHVLEAALDQATALGCDLYGACAPAIASLLGADLYSADRRAHAGFPGVRLIG